MHGNWKKVVLFMICFTIIQYLIIRIFPSHSAVNNASSEPLNSFFTHILHMSQKTASACEQRINLILNILYNTSKSEIYFEPPYSLNFIFWLPFIIKLFLQVPLSYSFTACLLRLKREQKINAFGFLENDNLQFKKSWKIQLRKTLLLLFPIILLSVISLKIILDYVNISNYHTVFSLSTSSSKRIIIELIVLILIYAYYYSQKLKYILSFKIAYDEPELSAKEIINKS